MSTPFPPLRSAAWFGTADKNGFMYRSWMKNQGIPDHEFQGKPIIGICNTWSELTPCNAHFRKLAEHVKRGVLEAGYQIGCGISLNTAGRWSAGMESFRAVCRRPPQS